MPQAGPYRAAAWTEPRTAYESPTLGSSAYLHYFYDQRRSGTADKPDGDQGLAAGGDPSPSVEDALIALIRDTFR